MTIEFRIHIHIEGTLECTHDVCVYWEMNNVDNLSLYPEYASGRRSLHHVRQLGADTSGSLTAARYDLTWYAVQVPINLAKPTRHLGCPSAHAYPLNRITHLNRTTKNGRTRKSNENSMKLWNSLTTMASSAKTESRRRRTSSSHQNHLPLSRPHHNRRINHRRQPRYRLSSHHSSAISMAMQTVTSSTASMAPSTRRQAQR